jgi:hypothetical protein
VSSDIAAILYSSIDKIGRAKIRTDLTSDIALSGKYCEDILKGCIEESSLGRDEETLVTLCEGLLHFMLTASLLPSERKVNFRGADLDVVVPSLKVLAKNPENAIIIQLMKNHADLDKITRAESVQPQNENIWIVSSKMMAIRHSNYHLGEGATQYSHIVQDINEFVKSKSIGKLKLLPGK